MQLILDVLPNPVFVKDARHRWILMNKSCAAFIGLPVEQLLGKSDFDVFPEEQAKQFWTVDDRVLATGEDSQVEEQITDVHGQTHWLLTQKRRVEVAGEPVIVCMVTNVTALREAEERSRYLALHDPLTGLPNRAMFADTLETLLAALQRRGSPMALLCLDLDGFKEVNDTLGHQAGDELLRQFGARIAALIRPGDMLARMGGDEFAVLLKDVDHDAAVLHVCDRIIAAAAEPFFIGEQAVQIGASVGVVEFADAVLGRGELLRRADVALYHAKHQGRGRYSCFRSELEDGRRHRSMIEADLRRALADDGDGLELRFQPLVRGSDGHVGCVEALVRWRHPQLGLLLPAQFVTVAEESGQIARLDEWVMGKACSVLREHPSVRLALNISPLRMRDPTLPPRMTEVLARHGFPAARVDVEVSETTLVAADPVMVRNLTALRALGMHISLDNFGTGYSALDRIRALQISRVKIDRSFIHQIDRSEEAKAMVRAMTHVAQAMKLEVTASGVETQSQSDFLLGVGCSELQGRYISDAVTENELLEALQRTPRPSGG